MPWIAAAAVVGSSLISSNASSDATSAQVDASNKGIAEQKRQFDFISNAEKPYRDAGYTALNALLSLNGLGPVSAPSKAAAPSAPSGAPASGGPLGVGGIYGTGSGPGAPVASMSGAVNGASSYGAGDWLAGTQMGFSGDGSGLPERALNNSTYSGVSQPALAITPVVQTGVIGGLARPKAGGGAFRPGQNIVAGELGHETVAGANGSMQRTGAPTTFNATSPGYVVPAAAHPYMGMLGSPNQGNGTSSFAPTATPVVQAAMGPPSGSQPVARHIPTPVNTQGGTQASTLQGGSNPITYTYDAATNSYKPLQNPGGVAGGYNFMTDPGYQFDVSQGMDALNNSYASKGGALSGNAIKAAIQYGQDYASNEFNKVYNRISGLASLGQNATAMVGNAGNTMANNVTSLYGNIGNANAAGSINTANSINGGIGQLSYLYGMNKGNSGYSLGGNASGSWGGTPYAPGMGPGG